MPVAIPTANHCVWKTDPRDGADDSKALGELKSVLEQVIVEAKMTCVADEGAVVDEASTKLISRHDLALLPNIALRTSR